jgi:uncharacterized protein (TIGR01777 family)
MSSKEKIILAGGSGFLGRTLALWFAHRGVEPVILSRQNRAISNARVVPWDGETPGPWTAELEGARAVVNLAGRSVNCRYNARNRALIMNSRVRSTRVLGEAIRQAAMPPPVWLNSSTATIYRHTFGDPHDESGPIGATPEARDGFSVEVAAQWEAALNVEAVAHTRKIALRTALVLGPEPGGVNEVLRWLARCGLGGPMAGGLQYVSWLHATDFCRAIDWLIKRENADGVYNLSAPEPVTNAEMMRLFRRAVGMPLGVPATRWMLEIGGFFLRTETELIIKSRRVVPRRLLDEGFSFDFSTMADAIADLENHTTNPTPSCKS